MPKGGNTVERVWKICEPIANELGLRIWDIRFLKEGVSWYLRIFIDKDSGISIDDCERMSKAIDKPLDDEDPIDQSYYLEVSSPGIERDLVRDEHFQSCLGQKIMIKTIRPVDSKRDFKGILKSFDNGMVTVTAADGSEQVFNKKETSYVKLDDFD